VTISLVPEATNQPTMQVDDVAKALGLSRAAATGYRPAKSPQSASAAASSSPQQPYAACCNWTAVPTQHEPKS
jgi:hypothetical protein